MWCYIEQCKYNWHDAETPRFKYAYQLNQWKGARVLGQTNRRGYTFPFLYKAVKCRRAKGSPCRVMLVTMKRYLDSQYAQVYSLFAYLQLLVFFFRFSSVVSGRSSGPGFIIEVNPQR